MHVSLIVYVAIIEVTSYERHGVSNIGNAIVCATGFSCELHKNENQSVTGEFPSQWAISVESVPMSCQLYHIISDTCWYILITTKSNIYRLALLNSVFLAHFKIHTGCLRGSGRCFCSMYYIFSVKMYELSKLKKLYKRTKWPNIIDIVLGRIGSCNGLLPDNSQLLGEPCLRLSLRISQEVLLKLIHNMCLVKLLAHSPWPMLLCPTTKSIIRQHQHILPKANPKL